jgi:dCMP deaminase
MNKEYFQILKNLAEKSPDPTRKVAALIVKNDEIISTGFNDWADIKDKNPKYLEKPHKYFYLEHAERNAIFSAIINNIDVKDSIMYINWWPCSECVKVMIKFKIKEIVVPPKPTGKTLQASFDAAEHMLNNSNIKVTICEELL